MLARASIIALLLLSGCAIGATNCLQTCNDVMTQCAADRVPNCDHVVQTCIATVCQKYW